MSVVAEDSPSKDTTLLIVETDAKARRSLRRAFERDGHCVIAVGDATAALRKLHHERCDLVVLNAELPGVNGLALCRLLRAQLATKRLPVVVLAARDEERGKDEALAAGADDFIVKPFPTNELVTRVNAHLGAALRERALVGSNRELAFLADLGRGLLRALEPAQVVRHVAGATYEGAQAVICAAVVQTDAAGEAVTCLFDREGSADGNASLIHRDRLRAWLDSAPAISARLTAADEFFLRDDAHLLEYAAPICFEKRTLGALIVAYDRAEDFGDTEERLVDAAAQQAALAAHISSLYATSRAASESLARQVEQRTAEAEAQRRFTEAIIDSLPVSLYAIDRSYRVVAWNRNRELGVQGISRHEAIGRNIFDVLTKQRGETFGREFARAFKVGEIERIEQETETVDGATQHWLISKVPMRAEDGEVSHVITVGEDITARVEANRAVARTEKLAAVGRLAAGVVHEINNPLATISACAEALESRVTEGVFGRSAEVDELHEYLGLIRDEAFRCKSITNGLLDFSRARVGRYAPVSVGNVVMSSSRLLMLQRRHAAVEILVDVADDMEDVSGDEGQLQQAVITLAENGIDAMPDGGTLMLRARPGERGASVVIEVGDTGIGIPQENIAKIFDPFFTTKEVGRGTGLGLAVCYGIVAEHGGRISVDSALGRGTTFTLKLPTTPRDGDRTA
ncbi:MAG: ATP-binding protein [Acidobacteriota bacterium]|nr:ATP-binding protein [Acidobacteriota bacterium]